MTSGEERIFCSRCKEWRTLDNFVIHTQNPELMYRPRKSCKVCQNQYKRAWESKRKYEPLPPGVTTKVCVRCKQEKPLTEFYKLRTGKWGLDPRCRECKAKGEAVRQRSKWHKIREAEVERLYGLSPDAYEALYQEQGKACAICGMPSPKNPLHVDHDHATGQVRGLLCSRCNTLIGHAQEKTAVLERAAAYLYAEMHNLNSRKVIARIDFEMKRYEW